MGLLAVQLLTAYVTSVYASSVSEPWLDPQLPKSLWPHRYHVALTPYISEMDFNGYTGLELRVLKQTKFIIVHAKGLNITHTGVSRNHISLNVIRAFAFENNSYWVVETEELMMTGEYIFVQFYYRGKLGILTGVTSTNVTNVKTGMHSPMVITMFKPNYARMAFPNLDEPYFKSKFTIELTYWANCTAVSNMPEDPRFPKTNDGQWKTIRFLMTPNISSFAVGFVISQYVSRNNTLPDGKPHRVWVRPERIHRVDYALNITYAVQELLNHELGNIVSLPKIDQFAIPFWLNRGGNAHWGLINQDETRLTYNSTIFGDKYRQRILTMVATDLAHCYFGGLVTCRYWNHVWLHSGLARFYGFKAAATIESVWLEEQQLKERGLRYDSYNNSPPLVAPEYNSSEDVNHLLFSAKGAAVLKMMENFLGAQAFKRGINRYIQKHSFKTAVTQDLFDAFQREADANTNVAEIMRTWVYSMGFPLITVQLLSGYRINATQKRFFMHPSTNPDSPPSTHGYKWYVPLNYRTKLGNTGRVWMNKTDAIFHNLLSANDDWIIFNYDQSGYYRVNYDRPLWNDIAQRLKRDHTVFTDLERSQLLSDALNIARGEQLGFDVALNLTLYASKEKCLSSWTHISNALENIYLMLANTSDFARFQRYVLNLTTNAMNELKVVDNGTFEERLLRKRIMLLSCSAGHRGCIQNTTRLFKAWIQNEKSNNFPVNIRRLIYCNGIANSAMESEWNTTFTRFLAKKELTSDREVLLLGLACTKNVTLLHRLLEACLSNNTNGKLWITDLEKAIKKFSANPAASGFIWNWIKAKRAQIDERFVAGASAQLAHEATYNFNTKDQLQEVRNFFDGLNSNELVEKSKKLTEERIGANIRWMKHHNATVSSWLQQNFP